MLFNGRGGEYECEIDQASRRSVKVTPDKHETADRTPPLTIHLGMCVLKKDAMDAVLARSTELGVASITPIISDHCAVSSDFVGKRQRHWQGVVVAACEQCGLNRLPLLHEAGSTHDWLRNAESSARLIALPGAAPLPQHDGPKQVSLLVGPEGGFSEAEVSLAQQHSFLPVTFGERILKAETAPVVAVSVLHRTWGDF